MTNDLHAHCPDTDTLAAFAEGKLKRQEMPPVLAHIEGCVRCMTAVEAVNETLAATPAAGTPRHWWLLAAAVALVLLAIPVLRRTMTRDPVSRLVTLAPADARVVEPRLSGGFPWAEYRGPLRAGNATSDPALLKLAGAAGELAEDAIRNPTPSAQHAAGVAMVLIDRPEEAIGRLEAATNATPNDAKSWNDLGAARYAAAKLRGRASLYPEALAAVDKALTLDPKLLEARFNRALILERMGLAQQARAAWQEYLAVDAQSPWAAEARQRLARIPATSGDADFRRELPRLETAAAAGDTATVATIVRAHPQQSRAYGEAEFLTRWGEAARRGDEAAAARALTIAREIGNALAPIAGETLLRDAVAAIDTAGAPRRALLAEGYEVYRRGRIAFSKQRPEAAEPDLRLAAERLAAGGSPMALVARYYAANAAYERNEIARAAAELEALLREVRTPALDAQIRWELALCRMIDSDWDGALALLESAQATFARLGERSNLATIESLRAGALVSLGRPDDAWTARIAAFEALSASGDNRLAVSLSGAAQMAIRAGRLDAAVPLLHLEQAAVRDNHVVLAHSLMREAALNAARGDADAALRNAADSAAAAARISDPALRTRAGLDAQFATAAARVSSDPRRAKELLDQVIAGYEEREMLVYLPESYLLRARAALTLGDRDAAGDDLERGIALIEKRPIRLAESLAGTGVLDAGVALYEQAIRLALDRGANEKAFLYAERSRGGTGKLAELTRLLGDSALLELVALPDEVIAFSVTADGLTVARTAFDRTRLASANEEALYDALIRPSEPALARARKLVVVAGPLLAEVPFAALRDSSSQRYLVERMSVAMAPNAFSLRREPGAAPQSVAAVALPSGDAAALPESEEELTDVAAFYGRAVSLTPARATFAAFLGAANGAEVVHIGGHTERQPGGGDAALLFAPDERVSWKRISTSRLGRPSVVVLAACETLRAPAGPQQRALSLGQGFLAAGAGAAVGTLTPIADTDARSLFRTVHRELAAGAGAAAAVRAAQLEALRANPARREGGWRALAVLVRHIDD